MTKRVLYLLTATVASGLAPLFLYLAYTYTLRVINWWNASRLIGDLLRAGIGVVGCLIFGLMFAVFAVVLFKAFFAEEQN